MEVDLTHSRLKSDRRTSLEVKEQILTAVGGFGKWQFRKCAFIIVIIWIPASFHLLNMVFFR